MYWTFDTPIQFDSDYLDRHTNSFSEIIKKMIVDIVPSRTQRCIYLILMFFVYRLG
jgi:hypothetical protein